MIKNKSDLIYYLRQDKQALKVKGSIKDYLFNDIWKFQKLLRKTEYYSNTNKKIRTIFYRIALYRMSLKLGFSIPINTCGAGLSIAHIGTIVISGKARIGENCRIHVCVNIGASAHDSHAAPKIGNNCYIGPGAKLYGSIELGDNIAIGANSVVNKSFNTEGVIAGVPARKISEQKLVR
ncbi:serine acetyltransferase [Pseudoalteromonas sp. Angola-30]|uniref:serine O-acetyltransferase n=1 Tax=Pseudoalteromonas sp. Angola-30 TaxID=3025341 RepID=UPI0023583283|nr:serine acetyltransferase [Pseudoalteromonas sp. Angola-30]MDC9524632.1 serine acetyltransferase [Pseudoalteromonas sp. Angola-30]